MKIFVSSLIRGLEEYRQAAREAIVQARHVPVMSEDQPAGGSAPRSALLGEIARCDAVVLLMGGEYGSSGVPSPTEEEVLEAQRLGKPILTMIQTGISREAAQKDFIDRVTHGWTKGRYRSEFANADQLRLEITRSLHALERSPTDVAAAERASQRANDASARRQTHGQEPQIRIVVAPIGDGIQIKAADLNAGTIPTGLAQLVRSVGLASELTGFTASEKSDGVEICESGQRFPEELLRVRVERDGVVIVEGKIAGDGQMGSAWIDPDRLRAMLQAACRLAPDVWSLIGAAGDVTGAFMQATLPSAGSRGWGPPTGNAFSMAGFSTLRDLVVPQAPLRANEAQLRAGGPADDLCAEIERAYRDAGAINT